MQAVVLTIHLLLALALILVVLLQRSEGGGLGMGGGGGGIMTSRGAATALVEGDLGARHRLRGHQPDADRSSRRADAGVGSVIDQIGDRRAGRRRRRAGPGAAGLEGDLLPPLPSEGPAAPPPVQ